MSELLLYILYYRSSRSFQYVMTTFLRAGPPLLKVGGADRVILRSYLYRVRTGSLRGLGPRPPTSRAIVRRMHDSV